MPWQEIYGHDRIAGHLQQALNQGRLASSFMFVGPPGVGKFSFAVQLARAILCETTDRRSLTACGECSACQQVAARTHPDLIVVSKPDDKNFLPVELLIGDRDHRMRTGLCHDIGLKPYNGLRKFAVIDDADWLNQEGANCLLKTLEEPPADSTLILISSHQHKQLPTIQSRCQIIRFHPLPDEIVAQILVAERLVNNQDEARKLAPLGMGSVQRALAYREAGLQEFRAVFFDFLAEPERQTGDFAKTVCNVVDQAGKDAPPRRKRLHVLADQAVAFYRHVLRDLAGKPSGTQDSELLHASQRAAGLARRRVSWPEAQVADCLDRCLAVHGQIDANANLTTLVFSWVNDLAGSDQSAATTAS